MVRRFRAPGKYGRRASPFPRWTASLDDLYIYPLTKLLLLLALILFSRSHLSDRSCLTPLLPWESLLRPLFPFMKCFPMILQTFVSYKLCRFCATSLPPTPTLQTVF